MIRFPMNGDTIVIITMNIPMSQLMVGFADASAKPFTKSQCKTSSQMMFPMYFAPLVTSQKAISIMTMEHNPSIVAATPFITLFVNLPIAPGEKMGFLMTLGALNGDATPAAERYGSLKPSSLPHISHVFTCHLVWRLCGPRVLQQ